MHFFRSLAALFLANIVLQSSGANAESCQSWRDLRPYLVKFIEVEGQDKNNLIQHFNKLLPRTNFSPDMVGYAWFAGEKVVRLYMVAEDCVIVDRYLPRKSVWQMMAGNAASEELDKSGKIYAYAHEQHNAAQEKAWQQGQENQQKTFEEDQPFSEEEAILNQDIN